MNIFKEKDRCPYCGDFAEKSFMNVWLCLACFKDIRAFVFRLYGEDRNERNREDDGNRRVSKDSQPNCS